MKLVIPLVFCAVAALMSGCCTIAHGTTQKLPVESVPSGARVYQNGEYVGDTPVKLKLKRNQDYAIRLEKDGYEVQQTLLESGMSNWAILDFILLPFLFVDLADGAFYSFPMDRMRETLVPNPRVLAPKSEPEPPPTRREAPQRQENADILQRLKNLKNLHDLCLISDEEYNRKQRQLLESL